MLRVRLFAGFVILPLAVVLLASSATNAQDEKKKRQGNRSTQGRRGSSRGGFSASPSFLIRSPQVQEDLKLSDEQKTALRDGPRLDFASLRDLPREEQQKKVSEYRQQADAKIKEVLNEEQHKRLDQIMLQMRGVRALADAAVAKELGLTEDQQKKLRAALNPSRDGQSRPDFRNMSEEERNKYFAERRAQEEKRQTDAMAVLTDDQKTKFERMKGKKIEIQFGRRGGRPGSSGSSGQRKRPKSEKDS